MTSGGRSPTKRGSCRPHQTHQRGARSAPASSPTWSPRSTTDADPRRRSAQRIGGSPVSAPGSNIPVGDQTRLRLHEGALPRPAQESPSARGRGGAGEPVHDAKAPAASPRGVVCPRIHRNALQPTRVVVGVSRRWPFTRSDCRPHGVRRHDLFRPSLRARNYVPDPIELWEGGLTYFTVRNGRASPADGAD